ncbi:sugar transferase [Cohnella lupini]|uniref:Exopolysaccharide biosynthesis polyprenyl glycosylphosphotransferase n=1 Tax=Cohnella lupini TaxID=1294267 RepID=A0A3D9ITR8_9BACL|nr:sugar transferase [Cohnella lupini]RED65047.1 exopolysaccharide biosynthesis polyprenyl glycosylphosphotransferase [Cohnella lupini]
MISREAELEISAPRIGLHHELAKRALDVTMALFGMIVLLPVFIVVGIAIKLDDPRGRIFFHQIRVGKNGKTFKMYKFRSMVSNADEKLKDILHLNEIDGAMFKMKEDPRITRIGKFIRKTSMDELPQFINVLKGEMSMVGPRPPLPREVESYSTYDRQRLQVVPGCTGLWQVSGRSSIDFKEMVELDLKYIKQRSIWFDIKLILRTISVLIRTKDAY